MPIAEMIPSRCEYYRFDGQPRAAWPKWLKNFDQIPDTRKGLIATATYETDDGEPEWWRWFEADVFFSRYRHVSD